MKRWVFGAVVFPVVIAIGVGAAWLRTPSETVALQVGSTQVDSVTIEPTTSTATVIEVGDDSRIEYFTDEKKIGRRGKNKIELRCFSRGTGRFAEIKFYSRTEYDAWVEIQSFRFDKDGVTGCDPIIEDFNNDGLKDFTFQSNVAARGSNEVRKLFIYDKDADELVYIRNSENYPNLAYNKKLNCIDSFMVHGTSTTVFLRIEGDSLREFASVGTGTERVVTVTDGSGERRIIRREKMNPDNLNDVYRRFSTYDPPR